MDIEEMILSRDEDIYDGFMAPDDYIEIKLFNTTTGRYETVKTLHGQQAIEYRIANGIW